jgi:FolB domain-containing protein
LSDNVLDTVNYRHVYEDVILLAQESQAHLLESLAKELLVKVLSYNGVIASKVAITKPSILKKAAGVTVEMTGNKNE